MTSMTSATVAYRGNKMIKFHFFFFACKKLLGNELHFVKSLLKISSLDISWFFLKLDENSRKTIVSHTFLLCSVLNPPVSSITN